MEQYYTIKKAGSYEKIIEKSRFIGHISRAKTEEEAQKFIRSIQKEYHDATHNCFAYLIGEQDQFQKANDDGEPGGTAGIPMLEVLKRLELKNVVIVITRYFGGIKLGAGGLIRAYSNVTSETIREIGLVKGELMQGFSLRIHYPLLGKIQNELHQSNYIVQEIEYLEDVNLTVHVPIQQVEQFKKEIINMTNDQFELQELHKQYVETDYQI